MKSRPRIRLETRVRRDQIADAVLAIAGEEGLQDLSVAAVAHRVGITPSALYRHYESKEAMITATFERIGDRWAENVANARRGARDPVEALRNLLMLHVAMIRESGGMPFVLFSEGSLRHPARRDHLLGVIGRFRAAVLALLTEAQAAGLVRRDVPPDTLAVMFIGVFQPGAILWHLTRGRFDVTGHARRAWALFEETIRTGATPALRSSATTKTRASARRAPKRSRSKPEEERNP